MNRYYTLMLKHRNSEWKLVGLMAGLAEPSGEVCPVSQAPVDSQCFAGPAQAGVPLKRRSTPPEDQPEAEVDGYM